MLPQCKKILYATDLSPNAGYVLRYALHEAQTHGARLVVLHVIESLPPTAMVMTGAFIDSEMIMDLSEEKKVDARERIRKRLETICKKELDDAFDVEEIVDAIEVVEGNATDLILATADEKNCDLIFMGTHGKGFLKHAYFGSTSKRVLRRVRKPVLIVPLPEGD
jgi:nucleotide-binding universal stress UspA family protein